MTPMSRNLNEAFVVYLEHDALALDSVRGHVQNVGNGLRNYFTSVDELTAFFRGVARRSGTPSSEGKT